LVLGAVLFFVILVAILRSAASGENRKPVSKKEKKPKPIPQKQKQKRGRSSLKKSERPEGRSEWVGVDSPAKDAEAVLEFLKGKDPAEIAKQHVTATKATKKAKKAKEAVQESDESASESVASDEGFEEVKKNEPKKKKNDKKKEKKPEDQKEKSKKPFFKLLRPEDGGPPVEEQRRGKRDRNANTEGASAEGATGGAAGGGERKARPEGERAERKARPEGERRKPRSEGEEKPVRRPITSPPNVKYEEADLNDILNSITQEYKQRATITRIDSIFSNYPRQVVAQILAKLTARDLVALSEVNHYFMGIARKDSFWRDLAARDFGVRDGKIKNFRVAYKKEYKKRKHPRKEEVGAPLGEEKDRKAKGAKGFTRGNKKEPATEEAIAQQE